MLFWLLACPSPEVVDSTPPIDSGACRATYISAFPADASTDAYWRTPIAFYLTEADPSALIQTDIPGTQERSADGREIRWKLSEALLPNHSYTVSISGCFGSASTTFQTSNIGSPLEEGVVLEGKQYLMALDQGRSDTQVADLLAPYLGGFLRLEVVDVRETALSLRASYSRTRNFDENCEIASQFAVFNDAPYFVTIPGDIPFPSMYDVQLSGTFTPDGQKIEGIHLRGTWDIREVPLEALNIDYTADQLCGMMQSVKLPCVPCRDGAAFCADLSVSLIPANPMDAAPVPEEICTGCNSTASTAYWLTLFPLFLLRPRRHQK